MEYWVLEVSGAVRTRTAVSRSGAFLGRGCSSERNFGGRHDDDEDEEEELHLFFEFWKLEENYTT